jgi:predicted PurR-regulated permease PerM
LLGQLNDRFHLQQRLTRSLNESGSALTGGVLGNVLVSLIAAVLTFGWLLIFKVSCPLLLAILGALLDLIPVLGSTIAGIMVCLAALTVSPPVALATGGFFVIYRGVEDYLLVPKIIGRVVKIPGLVTVVAILLGGALFGVIGALVAIPIAAAVLLVGLPVVTAEQTTHTLVSAGHGLEDDRRPLVAKVIAPSRWSAQTGGIDGFSLDSPSGPISTPSNEQGHKRG